MSTFLQLKNLVYAGLARDTTDPAAALVVPAAVNWAIKAAAILFKPVELATISNMTVLAGNNYVTFSTDFIDIQSIYVITPWKTVHFVPFESFYALVPLVTANPTYYTIFGQHIIVNGTMAANLVIKVYWLLLPTYLTSDGTPLPFDGHDSFITALASSVAFAMFEEGETVDMWAKMSELLGMPLLQRTKMQEVMMGIPASLEAQLTGTLQGVKT